MRPQPTIVRFILALVSIAACSELPDEPQNPGTGNPPGPGPGGEELVISDSVTLDPTGYAPLSARIELVTSEPVSVDLRVVGRRGSESDVVRRFPNPDTIRSVLVLGLYFDHINTVELTLFDTLGATLDTLTYALQTPPAPSYLPAITIDIDQPAAMAPGMTLVSYYGHDGSPMPNRPFIFDRFGDVRWVLDYEGHPEIGDLFFDDGIERLANGNFYFGDQNTNRIYEIDMAGEILNAWDMPGFGFHHQVLEMPNGNFVLTAHNRSISTVEDHLIEIDRTSGAIVDVWDLRESLDQDRQTWTDNAVDWVHLNAVEYDENDDTIIVSGRTQGVIKLNRDNEVVWILAPHRGWDTAGDGTDLTTRLLQPLDAGGTAITDPAVLEGDANHPAFEWNWYQHAPLVMPDGNVMLFDNGDNRNYGGVPTYSRAVEYEIDEVAMTVRQAWQYGKERGTETYSRIVSDVDYDPTLDHVFFSPGAIASAGAYGKVVEVDRSSGDVLFEATITPPMPFFIVTFHRTERLTLYPGDASG